MNDIVTIGETMAAFTSTPSGPLRYANTFQIHIAGGESNVAIGMAKLGHKSGWISKLGEDEFGYYILNEIRSEGVDCSKVIYDNEHKTGVMFKQICGSNTEVIYYRTNSACCNLSVQDLNSDYITKTKLIHITGITPILSESCKEAIDYIYSIAKKNRIPISFDPNIRLKLWKNHDYTEMMQDYCLKSKYILLGEEEAERIFHVHKPELLRDCILERNPEAIIGMKMGDKGAYVIDKFSIFFIPPCRCNSVDSVGAGDAFNAGFLSGILRNKSLLECGKMGAVCGAMATEVYGDVEGCPSYQGLCKRMDEKEVVCR